MEHAVWLVSFQEFVVQCRCFHCDDSAFRQNLHDWILEILQASDIAILPGETIGCFHHHFLESFWSLSRWWLEVSDGHISSTKPFIVNHRLHRLHFQCQWWIHLHNNPVQHLGVLGLVRIVLILLCYQRFANTIWSGPEILHREIGHFLIVLARFVFWPTNLFSFPHSSLIHFLLANRIGVGLAILEKAQIISPIVDSTGATTSAGTVSAGYQNFFICLEMLFAAIALRYAFPYQVS